MRGCDVAAVGQNGSNGFADGFDWRDRLTLVTRRGPLSMVGIDDPKAAVYKGLLWAAATLAGLSVSVQVFVLRELYTQNAAILVSERQMVIDAEAIRRHAAEIAELRTHVSRLEILVERATK